MAKLLVSPKEGDSYAFPLSAGRITIGRSQANDLVLDDECCSGRHAAIFPTAGGYAIQDLNSKNHTRVNDELVFQRTDLRHGDEIKIGSTILHVDLSLPGEGPVDTDTVTPRSGTVISVPKILGGTPAPPPLGSTGRPPGADDRPAEDREFANIIGQVNRALIYSDLKLDKYLDRIMTLIAERIPMDRGILMLKDKVSGKLGVCVTKLSRHRREAASLPTSRHVIDTAFKENSAVLIPDMQAEPPYKTAESVIIAGIHSAMCAPLYDHKAIAGVIYADRISVQNPFNPSDLKLLTFLASLAAGKIREDAQQREIEAAHKYLTEIEQAKRFQRNLLPKNDPDFPPFEISGRAVTSPTVGGDYYDYLPLGPSRLGLVIADVAGTGVGASIIMSLLNGSLQVEAQAAKDLEELSVRLSEIIYKKTESTSFVSFFMGIVDRETGQMNYVNAGHNYPLLLDPTGHVRPLVSTGMCLGMLPCETFETSTVTIGAGDLLCLFTDGITERRDRNREEFGETRLVEILRTSSRLAARQVLDKVYETVEAFSPGTEPEDDMTLVILKRKAG
jgi:sigma-B regulation protein RsbU (phosphoserine phosphatase)